MSRAWISKAVRRISADFARSADTHLIRLELPQLPSVRIYLKDESTHPTGSLKHRLARSLILYGICNGWIREGRPIIEVSSGSTAISEAYFAKLLGLPFIAVVPASTAQRKIAEVALYGGRCHLVDDPSQVVAAAERLAGEMDGHFVDQFTYAERATDWRGNNNIAESLFSQMAGEEEPCPDWVVVGAGTGGTSATIGRYIRYRPEYAERTRLCVVDPECSAFFAYYRDGTSGAGCSASSVIEGVGRPQTVPSFLPAVVDRMIQVPDAASIAACLWLSELLGRRCGPSTGLNMIGVLTLAAEISPKGGGSIASLICDSGERYADTVFDDAWIKARGIDLHLWTERFTAFSSGNGFRPELPTWSTGKVV
jgi:cysteine synthase A